MNMRIAAILLLGYCAGMSTPAFAQKKDKLKKGPNISLNISAKKDSVKTTYLNIGLLTNIYQLKGIGINAVSSVVQNDMTGFQISGLASITGRHASGFQLGGIANVAGGNANGIMLSGLDDTGFVDRKIEISEYMFFAPLFFAYIGISADLSRFRLGDLLFGAVFVLLGIVGKIIGFAR